MNEKLISYVLIDSHGHIKDFTRTANEEKAAAVFLRHRKDKPFPQEWAVVEREVRRRAKRNPDAPGAEDSKTREIEDKIRLAKDKLQEAILLLS